MRQAVINCMPQHDEEVLDWLRKVEERDVDYRSLAHSGKFKRLDIALATDIARIARGELGRTITRTIDVDASKGRITKGRQLLWLIYDYNKTNEDAGALYDFNDLMKVEWISDNKMETFSENLENVLSGCTRNTRKYTMCPIPKADPQQRSTSSRCCPL